MTQERISTLMRRAMILMAGSLLAILLSARGPAGLVERLAANIAAGVSGPGPSQSAAPAGPMVAQPPTSPSSQTNQPRLPALLPGLAGFDRIGSTSVQTNTLYFPATFRDASVWKVLMQEGFEGAWPSAGWSVNDNAGGAYLWGKRNCRAASGNFSAWAMGGGTAGSGLGCGANYIDNALTTMIYGPISLSDANLAEFVGKAWVHTDSKNDRVCFLASDDGLNFNGNCLDGDSGNVFVDSGIDLSNVPGIGNMLGQPIVYVGVEFFSDGGGNTNEGAYVDDLRVDKCARPVPICLAAPASRAAPNGAATAAGTLHHTLAGATHLVLTRPAQPAP